ncbi:MAG: TetR/AcrR family transcriptional regulator [Chloroflexota bacterium]
MTRSTAKTTAKKAPQNETRKQIHQVAEELFTTRGYSAVTLRDIAEAVGMRHASLYYYAPGGKEQLYLDVMKQNFERHRVGMTEAIENAGDDIREQVHAVAQWLVSQPPLDLTRMQQADMPAIDPMQAGMLMKLAIDSLTTPLKTALTAAKEAGTVEIDNVGMATMALVTLMQSVHNIPEEHRAEGLPYFGRELADMLLFGWVKREE